MYLLKNPVVLSKLLVDMDKGGIALSNIEYYSVESIAINVDSLFNTLWIKELLQLASSKKYLTITYKKTDGFMYTLNENANKLVYELDGNYFTKLKQHAIEMQKIQAEPTSRLNTVLNALFKGNKI